MVRVEEGLDYFEIQTRMRNDEVGSNCYTLYDHIPEIYS
jgi:hypothetical protein